MDQQQTEKLRTGIAEILEVPTVHPDTSLSIAEGGWDSICVVSAISLIDEVLGITPDAVALAKCQTVADLEVVAQRALDRS